LAAGADTGAFAFAANTLAGKEKVINGRVQQRSRRIERRCLAIFIARILRQWRS
jgi:hypothetical protein